MAGFESKSADFYRMIADSSCDWEMWHGPGKDLIYVSPSSEAITGYRPEEFYNDATLLYRIIHPDDVELYQRHCADIADFSPSAEVSFRIIHRQGPVRWIGHSCRAIFDGDGKPLGRRSTNRDITLQKQLEEKLNDLAQFPRQNPDPVMRFSPEGVVLYMNPAAERLFGPLGLEKDHLAPEVFSEPVLQAAGVRDRIQRVIDCQERRLWLTFAAVDRGVHVYGRDFTEHKKTEERLRDSQQDLERAQSVAHIGSWRLRIAEGVLEWSDETYRIFGIPTGEPMSYERFLAAVHPEDRAHLDQCWQAAMGGERYDCEHRIVADGTVKWVREKAQLEFDAQGHLVSGFGTVQDITRQKREAEELLQVQHALYEGNQLLQGVLDNTHVLVACMDREFNFLRVNKAYAMYENREVEFFPGKNHFDLYPNAENEAIFRQAVETGEPYMVYAREFKYAEHPERGSTYWDWSLAPIRDEQGQVARLVLTLADVTKQKKSHDLHERMMRRQAALVQASEEILQSEQPEQLLETISRAALVITQSHSAYVESTYGGKKYSHIACARLAKAGEHQSRPGFGAFRESLYQMLSNQGKGFCLTGEQLEAIAQQHLKLPTGHPAINGMLVSPLVSRDGSINGLILMSDKETGLFTEDDEAELKQLAAISSLALQHLEARDQLARERDYQQELVRHRTEDLERTVGTLGDEVNQRIATEVELQATNIELQRRAERLSRMASELTIAEHRERQRLAQFLHDGLQQDLTGIKLHISMVLRKITQQEPVKTLKFVIKTLENSIDSVRLQSVELYPPVLHEAGLVGGLEWLVRRMKEQHGLTVQMDKAGDVNINREDVCILLFQSVRELLFNTVKHAGVKQAQLVLRRKGDFVQVKVRDEGKGFDPEEKAARGAGKSDGGFGLFSIRERLASLGGKLEIISAPEAGCTFILRVPADVTIKPEELATVPRRKIEDIRPSGPAVKKSKTITILLVDDHTIMRRGLATLLRQEADMKVVGEAADGEQAVELARRFKPQVVLMDFGLPGINGAEATRMICGELPEVRVIGLSMFDEEDRAASMFEAGACAYASKSESPDILLEAIRIAVSGPKNQSYSRQKNRIDLDPSAQ